MFDNLKKNEFEESLSQSISFKKDSKNCSQRCKKKNEIVFKKKYEKKNCYIRYPFIIRE